MGYNIGFFNATDGGYAGTIETLSVKAPAEFTRVLNRTNEKAPAYEVFCGQLRIGVAWEYEGKSGKYLSVSLEDPSFSSGFYNLYRNKGTQEGYTLVFERHRSKKDGLADTKQAA
jgi:uncharacterized protein (DUF736 family)